jgi:hypothetical protein
MYFLHDGQQWEVVDITWDGWVAVLFEGGCRTHYRALFPFNDPPAANREKLSPS